MIHNWLSIVVNTFAIACVALFFPSAATNFYIYFVLLPTMLSNVAFLVAPKNIKVRASVWAHKLGMKKVAFIFFIFLSTYIIVFI